MEHFFYKGCRIEIYAPVKHPIGCTTQCGLIYLGEDFKGGVCANLDINSCPVVKAMEKVDKLTA